LSEFNTILTLNSPSLSLNSLPLSLNSPPYCLWIHHPIVSEFTHTVFESTRTLVLYFDSDNCF
jgi:hypothetical protein